MCVSKVATPAGCRLPLLFTDGNPSNYWWTGWRVNCRRMVGRSWRWQAGRRNDVTVPHPSAVGSGKGTRQQVCLLDHILPRPPDTVKNQYICIRLAQAADCARSGACVCVCMCVQMCVCSCLCAHLCLSRVETGSLASTLANVSRMYLSEININIGTCNPAHRMTAGLMSASESPFTATLEVSRQRL